jgi:regulatory protein
MAKAKTVTQNNIENMGLYYLERFSTTKAHFKKVMTEKIKRRCKRQEIEFMPEFIKTLDVVADKFETLGYLNDTAYTESVVRTGYQSGKSSRKITAKLLGKGVESGFISQALTDYTAKDNTPDNPDLYAGVIYIKKKKLGCFDTLNKITPEKSLQRLAYAGFSYDISKKLLEMDTSEAEAIFYR